MKYLLMAVLAGLFISPVFAEEDNDERNERRERRGNPERKERMGRKGQNPWKFMQNISAEERVRLSKLRTTDPEAFKDEITKIVKRFKAEKKELDTKIKSLVKQYKNAEDAETKKETMEQLRKITQKIFLEKMQKNKKRLESLESHVKKMRKDYDFRKKNAKKIIQTRLNTLTNNTKFDW